MCASDLIRNDKIMHNGRAARVREVIDCLSTREVIVILADGSTIEFRSWEPVTLAA